MSCRRFWLVRHGHYNQDTEDLTESGERQIRSVARRLNREGVRAVVRSSPAQRAISSARILAQEGFRFVQPEGVVRWLAQGHYRTGAVDLPKIVDDELANTGMDLILVMHQPDIERFLREVGGMPRPSAGFGTCWQMGSGLPHA